MATGSTYKSRVLSRLNLQYSHLVTDAEFIDLINSSASELYTLLLEADTSYFVSENEQTIANDGYLTVPTDMHKLLTVDKKLGTNNYLPMHKWQYHTRFKVQNTLTHNYASEQYRLFGDKVKIMPEGKEAGTYRLWYMPKFAEITALTDSIDDKLTINNVDEYIVLDLCIKIRTMQDMDPSIFLRQKEDLVNRVMREMSDRDGGFADVIQDVRDDFDECYGIDPASRRW